jgi:hypothetical protein
MRTSEGWHAEAQGACAGRVLRGVTRLLVEAEGGLSTREGVGLDRLAAGARGVHRQASFRRAELARRGQIHVLLADDRVCQSMNDAGGLRRSRVVSPPPPTVAALYHVNFDQPSTR